MQTLGDTFQLRNRMTQHKKPRHCTGATLTVCFSPYSYLQFDNASIDLKCLLHCTYKQ